MINSFAEMNIVKNGLQFNIFVQYFNIISPN